MCCARRSSHLSYVTSEPLYEDVYTQLKPIAYAVHFHTLIVVSKDTFAHETKYFCVIYYVIRGVELRPMSQWLHHLRTTETLLCL